MGVGFGVGVIGLLFLAHAAYATSQCMRYFSFLPPFFLLQLLFSRVYRDLLFFQIGAC